MKKESDFKTSLINKIEKRLPGAMVFHLDAGECQGIPDLLVIYKDRWAALEGKDERKASQRPNQEYYVNLMNEMSYASFVYPENEEEVLNELQQALQSDR